MVHCVEALKYVLCLYASAPVCLRTLWRYTNAVVVIIIITVSDNVSSLQAEETALFSVTMSSGVTYFSYQVC